MRNLTRRRVLRRLTIPELRREIQLASDRLVSTHARLPLDAPRDLGMQIAGAYRFLQTAAKEFHVRESKRERMTEHALMGGIPVIRKATSKGFNGFGGNCCAVAVAINRVFLEGWCGYLVIVNDALYATGRAIGHAAAFTYNNRGVRCHIDADGRIKANSEVESWGRLDVEDADYQALASGLGIEWNDETAESMALSEATDTEMLQFVSSTSGRVSTEFATSEFPGIRNDSVRDREREEGSSAPHTFCNSRGIPSR